MPAALLGQKTEQIQQNKPEEVEYATAFMVLVTKDGNYVLEPNINKAIITERPPTPHEIKGSLATIMQEIASQETAIMSAEFTVNRQMQMARQAYEQQQNQQLLQQMKPVG